MSKEKKSDIELIELTRKGDKNAFGVLFQRYQVPMQRFAARLMAAGESACDLAQEAMVEAYSSLDNLREPAKFKSWLYGIMLNIYRSRWRDRKIACFSLEAIMQGLHFLPAPLYDGSVSPEELAEERERYNIVFDAVNSLPAAERDTVLLFYYTQLSLQEMAAVLNVPAGTIKVRLHRARQRLKTILQEHHPEIIPAERRRKQMVKVTIADVIKVEQREWQEKGVIDYLIVLYDEADRRLMPIWIGACEGESIAAGLSDFATPRPMTHNFYSSLLQAIDTRVEEIRVVSLKKDTFYAIVKMRRGKKISEVDARPSDAIALAVLNDSPIFVDEDVLETAGIRIPDKVKGSPTRKGLEKIIKEMEERKRTYQARASQQSKQRLETPREDIAKRSEEFIAAIFEK